MDSGLLFEHLTPEQVNACVVPIPGAHAVSLYKVNPYGDVTKRWQSDSIFYCWGDFPLHMQQRYFPIEGSDRPIELWAHPFPEWVQSIKASLEAELKLLFSVCIFRMGSTREVIKPIRPCVILALTEGYRLDFDGREDAFSIRLPKGSAILISNLQTYTIRAPPSPIAHMTLTFI